MKIILMLSVIPILIFACGDSNDNGSPIIYRVVTPNQIEAPSDFPDVPEGYPENLTPVWLKDYFDENSHSGHVIIDRVLIELWNQGDHDFVSAILDPISRKVYPIYPDVVYVSWADLDRDGPDGKPMKYVSGVLGPPDKVSSTANEVRDKHFTEAEVKEVMAGKGNLGDLMVEHPDLKLVDRDKAGHKPKDVLVDYCNQPGNRARVPYCR